MPLWGIIQATLSPNKNVLLLPNEVAMSENNIILSILQKEFNRIIEFITSLLSSFYQYKLYFWTMILVLFTILVAYSVIKLYLYWKEAKKLFVLLEVSPPSSTEQSSFTTSQLVTSVYGVLRQRSGLYRVFDTCKSYSLEIVSTKNKGIRYIFRISIDDAQIIKKNLLSYLPGVKVTEVADYLNNSVNTGHVIEFELSNYFTFSLKKQDNLKEFDPIAYITGTMTKLSDNEMVSIQTIISPINRSVSNKVMRLRSLFLSNKDVLTYIKGNNNLGPIFQIIVKIATLPLGLFICVLSGGQEGPLLSIRQYDSKLTGNTYKNTYGGTETDIGLTADERRRHVYILGATGTGKSTMLLSMIKKDIEHKKGLCVIDPHGDLIEQVLSIIPKERIADTIYFNPDDISYPMGINLLELTQGLSSEDALREKEFIAESIISVFNKIYTEKYSGPRMEYILRNTIHTTLTVPDATLFTVYKLLINTGFRKSVVNNLSDENLKDFWKYEFAKAGDYQKVKMISPITNKIGRFLFSPTAKRIFDQGKSTINFDTIINEGKILLCNLSKGKVGEDNSSVFGVLIMAKIQLAALKRARMKQEERKDFYLYVDEFQNFATPAFAQILSEARKYRLGAILAHQTTSQLEDKSLVNVTLANTGTIICFRTSNPEDERLILPQFSPYVTEGEIASLPSYNFYIKINAITPEEPFSGETISLPIIKGNKRVAEVVEISRSKYTLKYETKAEPIVKAVKKKSISPDQNTPKAAGISFS